MVGGSPILACPRCGSLVVAPYACASCGYAPPYGIAYPAWSLPSAPAPFAGEWRRARGWRRTRRGLAVTAAGLLLSWVPFLSALGALFLSLGSTLLFLGARGAGRKHEVAVVLAFLLLAIGGVAIGIFLGSFLLRAYEAAHAAEPLSVLADAANLLVWATLPATGVIAAGFALQIVFLVPRQRRRIVLVICAVLIGLAALATWLSGPEVAKLGAQVTRASAVTDFLFRLSLWRVIEAPAYVGLALAYLAANADPDLASRPRDAASPPGKG